LDFTWTYTRSKELQLGAEDYTGLGLINDVFNRDNNKPLSASSRPNWMSIAFNYSTPQWGPHHLVRFALKDWMFGAVLQYGSGLPVATPGNIATTTAARFCGPPGRHEGRASLFS
jgi:hypothetical protein